MRLVKENNLEKWTLIFRVPASIIEFKSDFFSKKVEGRLHTLSGFGVFFGVHFELIGVLLEGSFGESFLGVL